MKKILFRKILSDCLIFFFISLLSTSIIVWVFQAVNFLDVMIEDGRSFIIYIYYTALNLPKIITKILPFALFFSFFYVLGKYEINNELIILWNSGINKIELINFLLRVSLIIAILQIIITTFIVPITQKFSRTILKTSEVDFIGSFVKEKKFNDTIKGLTLYTDKVEKNGELKKIYIKREFTSKKFQITYAKKGVFDQKGGKNILILFDGETINVQDDKISSFNFSKSDFNLSNLKTNTILAYKIQETQTHKLLNCIKTLKKQNIDRISHNCSKSNLENIFEELFKRILLPFYIPVLILISCLVVVKSKEEINYLKQRIIVFLYGFITIIISESSLKFIDNNLISNFKILIIPFLLSLVLYFIFRHSFVNKFVNSWKS